jgi:hypothetical protein
MFSNTNIVSNEPDIHDIEHPNPYLNAIINFVIYKNNCNVEKMNKTY